MRALLQFVNEGEKAAIEKALEEKNQTILNLNEYIAFGLGLRDNLLKLWKLADLGHKRNIQNLVFPNGIVWNKENDDIEPLSKNEFLFTYNLKSMGYEEKENGQTLNFEDLSALAPLKVELLNLWRDFRKVVQFIDENEKWLKPLLAIIQKTEGIEKSG